MPGSLPSRFPTCARINPAGDAGGLAVSGVGSFRVGLLSIVTALLAAACVMPPPEGPEGPPSIQMVPGRADGFFSLPWPNEVRKAPNGTLDLVGLPGVIWNPLAGDPLPRVPVLPALAQNLAGAVDDFGTNSAIFLRATGPLDPASLPTPSATTNASSPVQVIDLGTGERAPVIIEVQAGDRFRPDHLLTLLPYPGHPLRPATRYGVAITDGVRSADGAVLSPAPLLSDLDGGWDGRGRESDWAALRAQRDEVRAVLEDSTPFSGDDLVAFTVFRTQDTNRDLDAVAAAVATDEAAVSLGPVTTCDQPTAGGQPSIVYSGELSVPQFQTGEFPYLGEGGSISIGGDGKAVVQGRTPVPLVVKVPCGTPPSGGWPILTFVNGTGGGATVSRLPFSNTDGFVVASIPPLFGRGRNVPEPVTRLLDLLGFPPGDAQSELLFYNFLNPTVARSNPIQQAAEHLSLQTAVEHLEFDGSPLGSPVPVATNDATEVISGQSQGAQTLPLVAAAAPGVDGVFSAAGSGGQYHTLSHRQQQREALALFTGSVEDLDELNPIVQVVQTLLEGGDGINFTSDAQFVNVAGYADTCVPVETSRHFAGGLGLETVPRADTTSLYGDAALDPPVLNGPGPYGANADGRTRLNVELPGGHFAAYENTTIGDQFLAGIADGTAPLITIDTPGPSTSNCTANRYDDPPRRYAR